MMMPTSRCPGCRPEDGRLQGRDQVARLSPGDGSTSRSITVRVAGSNANTAMLSPPPHAPRRGTVFGLRPDDEVLCCCAHDLFRFAAACHARLIDVQPDLVRESSEIAERRLVLLLEPVCRLR